MYVDNCIHYTLSSLLELTVNTENFQGGSGTPPPYAPVIHVMTVIIMLHACSDCITEHANYISNEITIKLYKSTKFLWNLIRCMICATLK